MRAWPSVVALAPRITKTVANPRTKHALRPTACARTISALDAVESAIDWPAIYDTYAGTSGSTQGDRNEIVPATNTAVSEAIEVSIMYQYLAPSSRFTAGALSLRGSWLSKCRYLSRHAGSDRPRRRPACR